MSVRFGSWYAQSFVSRIGYSSLVGNPFCNLFKKKEIEKKDSLFDLYAQPTLSVSTDKKVLTRHDQMRLF